MKIYEEKKFKDINPKMRAFAKDLEVTINRHKDEGATPGDLLNVLVNGTVNLSRAARIDRELIEDFVKTCLDQAEKYPPESYRRARGQKTTAEEG